MPERSNTMVEQTTKGCPSQFLNKLLRLFLTHLCVAMPVTAAIYSFDNVAGYSFLLGGLIFLIPNGYFALYAFRCSGGLLNRMVLRNFYMGELGKFCLSVVGFAISFALIDEIDVKLLFAGYLLLTLVQWMALARLKL